MQCHCKTSQKAFCDVFLYAVVPSESALSSAAESRPSSHRPFAKQPHIGNMLDDIGAQRASATVASYGLHDYAKRDTPVYYYKRTGR